MATMSPPGDAHKIAFSASVGEPSINILRLGVGLLRVTEVSNGLVTPQKRRLRLGAIAHDP
jgi:hypothetical protein